MDTKENELRQQYKPHSTAKLKEIAASRGDRTQEYHVANQMIEEREFWKKFWTHGLTAWIALILSIVSIYIAATKRPNQALVPTPTAVTPAAGQPARQP